MMYRADLKARIGELWAGRAGLSASDADARQVVHEAVDLLDTGEVRVAEMASNGDVVVHEWLKQAILLLFKLSEMETTELGPFEFADKIPLKTRYQERGVRVVPGRLGPLGQLPGPRSGDDAQLREHRSLGGCQHDGGHLGDGWVVRPDRPQRAPVGRGRDRRRAGAAAGRAGLRGRRVPHRQPLHRGRRGSLSARAPSWARAASSPDLSRSSTPPAARSWAAATVPPWCVAVSGTRPRTFTGGEFGLPCRAGGQASQPGRASRQVGPERRAARPRGGHLSERGDAL